MAATITSIDTDARTISGLDRDGQPVTLPYDRLVLASGSRLVTPRLPGAEHLFDVDSMTGAARLHAHLHRLPVLPPTPGRFTVVVVGSGFTGVEVATELATHLADIRRESAVQDPIRIVLLEREDAVGPELGAGPRSQIEEALATAGVELRLGTSLASVTADSATLDDGTTIPTATTIWTAGMLASPLTAQLPADRDRLGRVAVDEHFRVAGLAGVYAAGDTAAAMAEPGHPVMQSCQHAVPQGKFAGYSVAADVLGLPPVAFAPDPYVTCLDLGAHGAVLTSGFERTVAQTGAEAKALKKNINELWIYPPVDDAELILHRADCRRTWPIDETAAAG